MFTQAWQVGLDIQSHCIRALAVQRRRNGWQLRHWWQQRLPQPVLREGCLEHPELLIQALRQWRIQLPRHISLRIALPAQQVLQQQMPLPDARLKEPARGEYITNQGLKQFPLDSQSLALDYRPSPADAATLLLTAARQQELEQWLHCLHQANLQPQAVDITPCALRTMATAAGVCCIASSWSGYGLHHLLGPLPMGLSQWRRPQRRVRRWRQCMPPASHLLRSKFTIAACWMSCLRQDVCPGLHLALLVNCVHHSPLYRRHLY